MANEKCNVCQKALVLDEENICAYCEMSQERNALNEVTQDRNENIKPNVNCGACKVIVEEDSEGLFCDVCNSWFHNNCNKTPLNYELYALLNEAPDNVKWFCDKCIWETEKWIKGVNKHYQVSGNSTKKIKISKKKENDKVNKVNEDVDHDANVVIKEEVNEDVHGEDVHMEDEDYIPSGPENEIHESLDSNEWSLSEEEEDIIKRTPNKKSMIKKKSIIEPVSENYVTKDILSIIDISEEKLSNIADGIKNVKKNIKIRYKCNLCPKDFINPEGCIAHKLRDHEGVQKPYKCSVSKCDFKANYKTKLKQHMETHSENEKLICHICGKKLKSESTKRKHLKYFHSNSCNKECDYTSTTKRNLKFHSCTVCNFKSKLNGTMKRHMQEVHATEKAFECKECNQKFVSKLRLKAHMLSHIPKNERPHACDQCDKRFNDTRNLKRHKSMHTRKSMKLNENKDNEDDKAKLLKTPTFFCDICNKSFKGCVKSSFKRHMLSHLPHNERPHACDQCDARFNDIRNLKRHKSMHTRKSMELNVDDKKLLNTPTCFCDICNKGFKSSIYLKRHKLEHTNGRPFKCETCGKGFVTVGFLNYHVKMSHEKKIITCCEICGYGAASKGTLNAHIKAVHDDTNYQCDECGKKYSNKWNLDKHKKGGFGQFGFGSCKGPLTQEDSNFKKTRQIKVIKDKLFKRSIFECDVCAKRLKTKKLFAEHKCREYVYTVECDKCGRKCRSESFLKKKHKCKIGIKNPNKVSTKKREKKSSSPKKKKLKMESNTPQNTYSAIDELNQDDSSIPMQETSIATDLIFSQHHGYQLSTNHMPTMQNHGDQPLIDQMTTIQQRDHMPTMQNLGNQLSTQLMPIMQGHENSTPTDHIPTMQNHGNQPPLLVYGNSQKGNVYAYYSSKFK